MELATLILTTAVALVGLWAAHSFGRQQRLRIAEQRLSDYRGLWKLMAIARVSRGEDDDPHSSGPVSREEALTLYDGLTVWYFDQGGGLSLPDDTKRLYLEVKKRIGDHASARAPASDVEGSKRVIRDLSLLRTQVKNDVGVYGRSYFSFDEVLNDEDKALLLAAGISPAQWLKRGRPAHARVLSAIGFDVSRWRIERDRGQLEAAAPAPAAPDAEPGLDTEPLVPREPS
jgi:hypothetical protein